MGTNETGGGRWRRWSEIGRKALAAIDLEHAVAVLPVAAVEQHGPHLPFGTDAIIGEAMIERTMATWSGACDVLSLPMTSVGKSDEHEGFAGTLSHEAETLIAMLSEIGAGVAASGVRRLAIVSSHGGNSEAMGIAARRLRLEADMLVVPTSWMRMGLPDGLIDDDEARHGIHGGEIETALLLHLRPDLVDMAAAEDFVSAAAAMETGFEVLRGGGGTGFAWATQDLNEAGALGNAAAATAETGAAIAAHQSGRMAALIADMARFDLDQLRP